MGNSRPPSADERIWIAAREKLDPQGSIDRISEMARHIFGIDSLFGTLLGGFGMVSSVALPAGTTRPSWTWLPLVFVTISLVAATLALTPHYSAIKVNDLDDVARFFRRRIRFGGILVVVGGFFFAAAIAATLPVAMWLPSVAAAEEGKSEPVSEPGPSVTVRPSLRVAAGKNGNHSLAMDFDFSGLPEGAQATSEATGFLADKPAIVVRHTAEASAEGTIKLSANVDDLAYERYEVKIKAEHDNKSLYDHVFTIAGRESR
jgi:hypothetical protein